MTVTPVFTVPKYYGYAAPEPDYIVADWQRQLDVYYDHRPSGARVVIYWEPGDPWQPIRRWFLGQAVDPSFVKIEPWVLNALKGPSPRSKGHYCAPGYCICKKEETGEHPDRRRWHKGATPFITALQWRMYRATGLYVTPWWVIQGGNGGHRYAWDHEELACVVSQMQGHGSQPPAAGDLPYATFDARVLRAIRGEWIASRATRMLQDRIQDRKLAMAYHERDQAEAIARHLWEWTGKQAEDLWAEGGDAIPHVLEMEHGRAPVGHQINYEGQEAMEERWLTRPVE